MPRQDGTGGKVRLGPISKRGNGYLRRLLVSSLPSGLTRWGAMAVLGGKRAKRDAWLVKLLAEKKRMVVACALANKACPGESRGWRASPGR